MREQEQRQRWRNSVQSLFQAGQDWAEQGDRELESKEYSNALAQFQKAKGIFDEARDGALGLRDGQLSNTINKELAVVNIKIRQCSVELNRGKVESLYKEIVEQLQAFIAEKEAGDLLKARDTLIQTSERADEAFMISHRWGLVQQTRDVKALFQKIREGFESIGMALLNTTGTTESDDSVKVAHDGVEVQTGSEDFRGYVRFRVSVVNDTSSIIANVVLKLVVDEKYLSISHVEPDFPLRQSEVTLGTISAGEAKTIAFYLDPQMCSKSKVCAHVNYWDSKGKFRSATSTEKEIGGKCPIFFTRDQANTAILKNLVEKKLDKRDEKVYTIPSGLAPKEAFTVCKEAIEGRDIQHVRDVVVSERPFEAIAWYYGQTKATGDSVVIAGITREETNSIELFVATTDAGKLTWLLAELGRDLNDKLEKKGVAPVQQVTVSIKDSIINRSRLSFGSEGSIDLLSDNNNNRT